MKVTFLVMLLAVQLNCLATTYINYLMMNTAIKHSLEENSRQKQLRSNQATATGMEEMNREKLDSFRQLYRRVEARMNSLGLLIDAGILAEQALPLVRSIKTSQSELLLLLTGHPSLLLSAAKVEVELAEKAVSILGYMTGILLTYGEINRMKPSDRKLLLNFARDELRALDGQSYRLLSTLRRSLALKSSGISSFSAWVNEDKKLIQSILNNVNALL